MQEKSGFVMVDILRMLSIAFQVHEKIADISLVQADVLKRADMTPGIRQVELAEQMRMQPAKLGRIVDQFAEMGLLERRKPTNDQRVNGLFVTSAASENLKIIGDVIDELWMPAWKDIAPQHVEIFRQVLLKIQHNLASHSDHPSIRRSTNHA